MIYTQAITCYCYYCWSNIETMSIRRFFKPIDGLPDPKGSLSGAIPREVQKVMDFDCSRADSLVYMVPSDTARQFRFLHICIYTCELSQLMHTMHNCKIFSFNLVCSKSF